MPRTALPDDEIREASSPGRVAHRRRAGRPTRHWLILGVTTVALFLILLAGGLSARAAANQLQGQVGTEFRAGQQALESGKLLLKSANGAHNLGQVAAAQVQFGLAREHFAAGRDIADRNRLLVVLSHIPLPGGFASSRLQAVDDLGTMGVNLSDAATTLADVDMLLIRPSGTTAAGAKLLKLLASSRPQLESARSELIAAQRAANEIDASVLPASDRAGLISARGTIDNGVAGIAAFQKLAPALADLLGGNGSRVYVIEQANAAELRSGGGFLGTVSVMTADHGTLHLLSSGDTYVFDGYLPGQRPFAGSPAYIAPPNVLSGWYSGHSWSMEDSNVAPDFATNAKWAETFALRRQGIHADGVIAMDFYAVASLLKITGPVTLPDFGVTLTSANFVDEVVRRDLTDPAHKNLLTAAATPLIERISNLSADQWPGFLAALNDNVINRHLQASFNNGTVASAVSQFGWSPALNPQKANDFMMETEDNFGGNKANQFVTRHYSLTLSQGASGLHHHVVIDLLHKGPPAYTPWYSAYARFYAPGNAKHVTMHSSPTAEYAPLHGSPGNTPNTDIPAGYTMADGWFVINVGGALSGRYQLVVDYDTPWSVDASGNHTIYWQKQPGTLSDKVDVTWHANGQDYKVAGDLGQDRLLVLGQKGVTIKPAQSATAHLPGLSL